MNHQRGGQSGVVQVRCQVDDAFARFHVDSTADRNGHSTPFRLGLLATVAAVGVVVVVVVVVGRFDWHGVVKRLADGHHGHKCPLRRFGHLLKQRFVELLNDSFDAGRRAPRLVTVHRRLVVRRAVRCGRRRLHCRSSRVRRCTTAIRACAIDIRRGL